MSFATTSPSLPTLHRYYCGIDLHARRMYICVLDAQRTILVHRNGPATPVHFLATIAAYREDLVVAVECIFTWYWLADLCAHEVVPFVLGHALYMKAIHGGKQNDKIVGHKIAVSSVAEMLPMAYSTRGRRATRDPLHRAEFMRSAAASRSRLRNAQSVRRLAGIGITASHRPGRAFSDAKVRRPSKPRMVTATIGSSPISRCVCGGVLSWTTPTPSIGCARSPGSARSWPWCSSTRSTTSSASRACRTSSPTVGW